MQSSHPAVLLHPPAYDLLGLSPDQAGIIHHSRRPLYLTDQNHDRQKQGDQDHC